MAARTPSSAVSGDSQDGLAKPIKEDSDTKSLVSVTDTGVSDVSSTRDIENGEPGRVGWITSKRKRAKSIAHQLKLLPKRMLQRTDDHGTKKEGLEEEMKGLDTMTDSPLSQHARAFQREHKSLGGVVEDGLAATKTAVQTILHPRTHTKRKAAGMMTTNDHPFLEEHADEELLEAHDELVDAKVFPVGNDLEARQNLEEKREKFDEVQMQRNAARSAWALGKHVERVRRAPSRLVDYPKASDFDESDKDGNFIRWQWERYFGHLLLYGCQGFAARYVELSNDQPFQRDVLIHILERVLIASAPWQTWLMHIRKVYHWEEKLLSIQWLATYFFLLKTGYIMTFAYLWIIYITVKHKVFMDDIRFVREAHDRARTDQTPQKLSELVQRHGGENWVDPLLDELGPLLQQQLTDLADFLEILNNFYTWRKPRNTLYTMTFWLTCAVLAASTSTEYGVKVIFWISGIYFFFSRPIASIYPKYRKIVSLARWVHWDIPTNAELAFEELQMQAEHTRAGLFNTRSNSEQPRLSPSTKDVLASETVTEITASSTPPRESDWRGSSKHAPSFSSSSSSESDQNGTEIKDCAGLMSFPGKYDSHRGHLIIGSNGVRFIKRASIWSEIRNLGRPSDNASTESNTELSGGAGEELWKRPYASLVELRKTLVAESRLAKRKPSLKTNALVFEWSDGTESKVWAMKRRDEAFNAIIGFSGLRFQVLPPFVTSVDDGGGGFLKGDVGHESGSGKLIGGQGSVVNELARL